MSHTSSAPFGICKRLTFILAVSAALISNADAQTKKFDGKWSLEVITERGDCDRAYRYYVMVEQGRVRYAGAEDFVVSGLIAPSGAVRGFIARGQDRVNASGVLSGNF